MANQVKTRCVFLDRDGVLNEDRVNYAYRLDHFRILPGVPEALATLRKAGYLLVVVTNQSGIAQGIYTREDMQDCHDFLQQQTGKAIDHFYFCPYHPTVTASLARKPGTLMFEKAIAKFKIDVAQSWMIGDKGRDIIPARAMGIKTIQIGHEIEADQMADYQTESLPDAAQLILQHDHPHRD